MHIIIGIINIINNGFKVDDLRECLQKYGFGKRQLKGKQKPNQCENKKNSQQPVSDG